MAALQAYLLADGTAHLAHQRTVEGGCHAQTRGKDGGSNGHVSVGCLLSQEDGNAQTGLLQGIALHGIAGLRCQLGCQTVRQRLPRPWVGTVNTPISAHMQAVHLAHELLGDRHCRLAFEL